MKSKLNRCDAFAATQNELQLFALLLFVYHALLGKNSVFTVSGAVHFGLPPSFVGYQCTVILSSSKIETNHVPCCSIEA